MNLQELVVAAEHKLPVKIVLLNNGVHGMVRQWQDLFYEGRYSASFLGKTPDFVKLADAYGIKGLRALKPGEVEPVLKEGLKHKGPVLMDIHTDPFENCYPMIPAGGAQHEMMLEDPPELKQARKGGTYIRERWMKARVFFLPDIVSEWNISYRFLLKINSACLPESPVFSAREGTISRVCRWRRRWIRRLR